MIFISKVDVGNEKVERKQTMMPSSGFRFAGCTILAILLMMECSCPVCASNDGRLTAKCMSTSSVQVLESGCNSLRFDIQYSFFPARSDVVSLEFVWF